MNILLTIERFYGFVQHWKNKIPLVFKLLLLICTCTALLPVKIIAVLPQQSDQIRIVDKPYILNHQFDSYSQIMQRYRNIDGSGVFSDEFVIPNVTSSAVLNFLHHLKINLEIFGTIDYYNGIVLNFENSGAIKYKCNVSQTLRERGASMQETNGDWKEYTGGEVRKPTDVGLRDELRRKLRILRINS